MSLRGRGAALLWKETTQTFNKHVAETRITRTQTRSYESERRFAVVFGYTKVAALQPSLSQCMLCQFFPHDAILVDVAASALPASKRAECGKGAV